METLRSSFEKGWRAVIKPPHYHYNINSVCPREQRFEGQTVERIDFSVPNDEGKVISAIILRPKSMPIKQAILYLHGNGGSKIEVLNILPLLSQHGTALISLDFIGCGNSSDGYLTYGRNEVGDAELVLREAYKRIPVEKVVVWGRSMGAITAIAFAEKNYQIVDKLVLDSPFKKLEEVIKRVIQKEGALLGIFQHVIFHFLKNEIEERLNFSVFDDDYLARFKKIPYSISVLFIASHQD